MGFQWSNEMTRVATTTIRTMACAATFAFSTAPIAIAQNAVVLDAQFVEDSGGAERINLVGKLRMLSQRVPASACYLQTDISTEDTRTMMLSAQKEFATITAALEFGNEDLGISGEETRRKTLVGISKLNELWMPISASVDQIASGNGTDEVVRQLADDTVPLLDMAILMVTEISQQYSQPGELLLRDSMVIDIAGRQRMLAQRVSKNICLISAGVASESAMSELEQATTTFETSLMALRNGMEAAGIQRPPTPEIEAGLDSVIADWQEILPKINRVLAGEQLDDEELSLVFGFSNRLTGGMNSVVGLYAEASKLGT